MGTYTSSIQYNLTGTGAQLKSFPFILDGGVSETAINPYTPTTLNEALGGTVGGDPISSSLIGSIIGNGEAAVFMEGQGFVGSLEEIDSSRGYWLKPYSGSFDSTAILSGPVRVPSKKYNLEFGQNLLSYPWDVNKVFGDAVDTSSGQNALHNQGIKSIIGASVAKTFIEGTGWVGSLDVFETGSGYWFRTDTPGEKNIWRIPSGDNTPGQELYTECTDKGIDDGGNVGQVCGRVASGYTGFLQTAEPPYSASGHTFGNKQTSYQYFLLWSKNIGSGSSGQLTSSLLDSASNDMSGAQDGTSDFIVGFFNTPTSEIPFPACIGAVCWHDHQNAHVSGKEFFGGGAVAIRLTGNDNNPGLVQFGHPNNNDILQVKVYDPRRDIVVTSSVHTVNVSNTSASIGSATTFRMGQDTFIGCCVTGSFSFNVSNPPGQDNLGGLCIKMNS